MSEEQRNNSQFCDKHGRVFCYQKDNNLFCSAYECGWTAPKRRKEDEQVPTIGNIRDKWQ